MVSFTRLLAKRAGAGREQPRWFGNSVIYTFYKETDYMRPNLPAYPLVLKMRDDR